MKELMFSPLFSGSSGNAIYVSGGETSILVDAGVSGTRIVKELANINVGIEQINGIFVTHEHDDHIKGVGILCRKYGIPIYATRGTWEGMLPKIGELPPDSMREITPGSDFYVRELNVHPFSIPHDARDPVGFSFANGNAGFSVATDIGCIRRDWLTQISGSQAVLLESNYDRDMLLSGNYPYPLKRRIDSAKGHLSNDDSAKAAIELVRLGVQQIILGHLSKNDNYPALVEACCDGALRANGVLPGRDVALSIANRDGYSGLFRVEASFR